ncbi:hypothetical protein [Archangium violaceum]|uniref:Lipoprotein n=1 Tax=Archangium violaceum Cb vi76 TaxID=1406225 RepID=A0A084SSP2_9BACT|nr:hypothetical protein [Archangium violaceum]KFA91477.1 hypothetical protein Q664_21965 [Archangium violaceum Cb vi76]
MFHIVWAVVLTLAFSAPSHAHPPAAEPFVLEVEALIDGREQLIIRGNQLQWHHFDFAAVGRFFGGNAPTLVVMGDDLGQVEWFPTWSEPVPDEIRFEDTSSVLEQLNPPLPMDGRPLRLQKLFGRGDVRIIQQPTEANAYTLIVEFDDNPYPGPRYYGLRLTNAPDRDGDGVADERDHCPNSDLRPGVAIGERVCPSNLPNRVPADGCTFNDRIALCAKRPRNSGEFVMCVDDWGKKWKYASLITSQERSDLNRCAAH